MNLEVVDGISRSLFNLTANIPNAKNKRAGLVKLSSNNC
jgi:hypothetical protein